MSHARKTLMFVGQNVANGTSDARNIMFSKDVPRTTKCICEKTGMWTVHSSPIIACASSREYISVPVSTAVAVMTTTTKLLDASIALNIIATSYRNQKQQIAVVLTNVATSLTAVANAANAALPVNNDAPLAENAVIVNQVVNCAVNTAKQSVKATKESHTANSILAIAQDILDAVNVVHTEITDANLGTSNANGDENIEIYTVNRNANLNLHSAGLIRAAMRVLERLLAAKTKSVNIQRVITTAKKTSNDSDIQPIAEKFFELLKAADNATRASAALFIAASAENIDELNGNISCIRKFLEKSFHKYNYICILQKDINVGVGIDSLNSMYMCDAVYDLFSTCALKNVVLVITNKDTISRSHTVLYEEAYRKISGSDSNIPIVCVNFNTRAKSEARALFTYELNNLRYSDTGKEYTPILPDASRYNFTYKLKRAFYLFYKCYR